MMDWRGAARSSEVGGLSLVRRGTTGGRRRCVRGMLCEMRRSVCVRRGGSECLKETQKVLRRLLVGRWGVRGRMHSHIPGMPASL